MEDLFFSGWDGLLRTLVHRGEFLSAALRRARVAEDEVRAAVRRGDGNGRPSLECVEGVRPGGGS